MTLCDRQLVLTGFTWRQLFSQLFRFGATVEKIKFSLGVSVLPKGDSNFKMLIQKLPSWLNYAFYL
jgi:hypothetical protein